jgi:protein CpxP
MTNQGFFCMKTSKPTLCKILLAAAVALPLFAMSGVSRAGELGADDDAGQPGMMQAGAHGGPGPRDMARGPQQGQEQGQDRGDDQGPRFGPRFGFGPPPGPHFGFSAGRPPMFHGMELTEAQEDQIFAILHAEAPYLREQSKAAVKAHEALRALAAADKYDDARAAALAQAAATAEANIDLQHVRTQQKLLAVLTPEQRKKQAEGKPHRPLRP